MRPRDSWEALSWAFWLFAFAAYACSLASCASVHPRASLALAADAANAVADVLEARSEETRGRFVAEVSARCGVPAEHVCATRVLATYDAAQRKHNALVLLQRSAADAIERAAACLDSGDRVCYEDASREAALSLARLREQVKP